MTKRRTLARLLPEILLAGVTLIVPVLLLALAYASPPDPAWIPGMYDDGDFDDVIVRVTSASGHVPLDLPLDARPVRVSVEDVPPLIEEVFVSFAPFASPPRAPPGL
jgi:hypothetical protein